MYYFSYGSNMSTARMRLRAPSATVVTVAGLIEHELRFHKVGRDGSGKCDIVETRSPADVVYGVVFEIGEGEKIDLDRTEGLGIGYAQRQVVVASIEGRLLSATTYYATNVDRRLKPFHWYKEHVVRGAREHGFPLGYVMRIEGVETERDPDGERHEREIAIYR